MKNKISPERERKMVLMEQALETLQVTSVDKLMGLLEEPLFREILSKEHLAGTNIAVKQYVKNGLVGIAQAFRVEINFATYMAYKTLVKHLEDKTNKEKFREEYLLHKNACDYFYFLCEEYEKNNTNE